MKEQMADAGSRFNTTASIKGLCLFILALVHELVLARQEPGERKATRLFQ
jgi:hypothetical protein